MNNINIRNEDSLTKENPVECANLCACVGTYIVYIYFSLMTTKFMYSIVSRCLFIFQLIALNFYFL